MGVGALLAQVDAGGYISVWKTIPVLVVLLIWARLLTWVDKDTVAAGLPRQGINAGLLGALVLGFLIFFFLPLGFFLNLLIAIVVLAISMGAYLVVRQQKVGLGDLSQSFKDWLGGMFSGKPKEATVAAGQVMLFNKGGVAQGAPGPEDPNK